MEEEFFRNTHTEGCNVPEAASLLAKLAGVKSAGKDKWRAKCPAHDDRVASLSVAVTEDRILIHCHAGCSVKSVVEALGMTMSDLFLADRPARKPKTRSKIIAVYDYTDAQGELVYQVVRYLPKAFRQRRPDGSGGWIWNLDGVNCVPYRLHRILEARTMQQPIYIVEGEKDVYTLESFGLIATTNAGGAGKWQPSFAEYFEGADVVIIPDNDEPGKNHAQMIAASLAGKARSVKVIQLPDVREKGDVTDWINFGHSADELRALAESTPVWQPPAEAAGGDVWEYNITQEDLTDLGNAERLIEEYGENLRFDVDAGKWLVWNGKRWEYDLTGEVHRIACRVIRGLYKLLPKLEKSASDALYAHIRKSQSAPRLAAMVDLASRQASIPLRSTRLDADPMLINCLNGTLDLSTGQIRPHARVDLITKLAPVEYDPSAKAPRWEQFLREVFQDNEELIAFVQRCVGYWLTGDTREQAAFILTGKGSNGKSTFIEALRVVLGDYAGNTPVTTFVERRDSSTADLAALLGKRLVTASEAEETQAFNEGLLKSVTGGDQITCRHLYREFFSYVPTYKIVFSTNEIPRIRSQNYAMKRRMVLIPFNQRFYDPADGKQPVRDPTLRSRLSAERNGIFAWAVRGCMQWLKCGIAVPDSIREEVDKLFESQDPLAEWIDEQCVLGDTLECRVSVLWESYLTWCDLNRRQPAYKAANWFSRALASRDGIEVVRRGKNRLRVITGIALANQNPPEMPGRTQTDANNPVSEKSPMKEKHDTFSAKAQKASATLKLRPPDGDSQGDQSQDGGARKDEVAEVCKESGDEFDLNTGTWETERLELLCWADDNGWQRYKVGPSKVLAGKRSWLEFLQLAEPEKVAFVLAEIKRKGLFTKRSRKRR